MSDVLKRMRAGLQKQNCDEKTAKSMLFWARSFLIFCDNNPPDRLVRDDIEAFLDHLKRERFAGRAGRQRALEAIALMYQHTEGGTPEWLKIMLGEMRGPSTPNILSREEVELVLARLSGRDWLAAAIVYGTGIRPLECMRLRVRDISLPAGLLHVRDEAGDIERTLAIPSRLVPKLQQHCDHLRDQHQRAVSTGKGNVWLPPALADQAARISRQWGWQYLFPNDSARSSGGAVLDHAPPSDLVRHADPELMHRKLERAAIEAGIHRRVTGQVLRNSHAVHMLEKGVPLRRLEQLLGARRNGSFTAPAQLQPGLSLPDSENTSSIPPVH